MIKDVIHLLNGILFGYKKDYKLLFATKWKKLTGIMKSELSQMERNNYVSSICATIGT